MKMRATQNALNACVRCLHIVITIPDGFLFYLQLFRNSTIPFAV